MKLSMSLNYAGDVKAMANQVVEYEEAGVDLVWVAEAYGMDAVSVMGYLAAITEKIEIASGILPIYTRSPTLLAMTAVGVDVLSGGRCVLGLGASGPQVIEGFHGIPYDAPIGRTREIIEICRKIWAREDKLVHNGKRYNMPLPEGEGTGLGKPLKIITHPPRPDIPILLASLGSKNVQLTAEVADGWLPTLFVPEKASIVWGDDLAAGEAKRDSSLNKLDIMAGGMVAIGKQDEVAPLRNYGRASTALYVGGMGAVGKNFYNNVFSKYGWEAEAHELQTLYLSGQKKEAEAAVPNDFLEASSLIGDESYIKDRLAAYEEAGVTYLNVSPVGPDPMGSIRKLRELIG